MVIGRARGLVSPAVLVRVVGEVFKLVAEVFNTYTKNPQAVEALVSEACCVVDQGLDFHDTRIVKVLKSRLDLLFESGRYRKDLTSMFYESELAFFS